MIRKSIRKDYAFPCHQSRGGIDHDPQMGWGRLAGGGLETYLIPGYHAHIVLEPRVRVLAKQLIAVLERMHRITGSEGSGPAGKSGIKKENCRDLRLMKRSMAFHRFDALGGSRAYKILEAYPIFFLQTTRCHVILRGT